MNNRILLLLFLLTTRFVLSAQDNSATVRQLAATEATLIGHHDSYLYGAKGPYTESNSDIAQVCGRYPAVLSVDFSGIELGRTTYSGQFPFDQIRKDILAHHRRGGLVTASWHIHNPINGGAFTDVSDRQVVSKMLSDTPIRATFLDYLRLLSDYILTLRDDNGNLIPILFRPWHECNGNWFFWGTNCCTATQYSELWKQTYDYLKSKGCSNLIYVFSPGSYFKNSSDYLQRYPGDTYVDVLGLEAYRDKSLSKKDSRKEFIRRTRKNLTMLDSLSHTLQKPYAITETGIQANTDSKWWTKAFLPAIEGFNPAFATLWANDWRTTGSTWATYKGEKSASNFKRMSKSKELKFLNR